MTASSLDARACAVCGADLNGRRGHAHYCGAGCRREAWRLRRLLAGDVVEGYRSHAEYVAGRQKRAKRAKTPPMFEERATR